MINFNLLSRLQNICLHPKKSEIMDWDQSDELIGGEKTVIKLFDAINIIIKNYEEQITEADILETLAQLKTVLETKLPSQSAERQQVWKRLISIIDHNLEEKKPISQKIIRAVRVFPELLRYLCHHPYQMTFMLVFSFMFGGALGVSRNNKPEAVRALPKGRCADQPMLPEGEGVHRQLMLAPSREITHWRQEEEPQPEDEKFCTVSLLFLPQKDIAFLPKARDPIIGSIHRIYLKKEMFSSEAVEQLLELAESALDHNFQVVLWIDLNNLLEPDKERLVKKGVTIISYWKFLHPKEKSLDEEFCFFLEKGLKGDELALRDAENILRMLIVTYTPAQHICMHVWGHCCAENLFTRRGILEEEMERNKWGLSFTMYPFNEFEEGIFIAKQSRNPFFWEQYLQAYKERVIGLSPTKSSEKTVCRTNSISPEYFTSDGEMVRSTFGNYKARVSTVDYNFFLLDRPNFCP